MAASSIAPTSPKLQEGRIARFGIASTAKVNRHLLAAALTSNVARIVAVASRSQDKADQYAKENDIPHSFGSYEQMFNSNAIDIVYVSVPNELHKSVTMAALRAKKHVLCEKPLTLTKSDAEEMFECAKENGVLLAEAVMTLHSGVVRKAKELVQSGAIGKLLSMRGNWMIFGGPSSSGGALWGLGSYLTNMARFISNQEPTHVSCHCVKSWKQHGSPTSSSSTSSPKEKNNNNNNNNNNCNATSSSSETSTSNNAVMSPISPTPSTVGHIIVDEKALEMNDDAAVVAIAKFPTFVLTFEASSGGPLSTCFEILGDKGSIVFDSPFKPKPEGSSLFVKIEKSATQEIIISDSELHGDVEHLYQMELDELARLSFKIQDLNKNGDGNNNNKFDNEVEKEKKQRQHEENKIQNNASSLMMKNPSKSSIENDDDDSDVGVSNNNDNRSPVIVSSTSSSPSPSDLLGQHLSPQFSICGAAVLELMQKSMERGGILLETNLNQPAGFIVATPTGKKK